MKDILLHHIQIVIWKSCEKDSTADLHKQLLERITATSWQNGQQRDEHVTL